LGPERPRTFIRARSHRAADQTPYTWPQPTRRQHPRNALAPRAPSIHGSSETAKVHDSQVWDELLHGAETSVWADRGYVSAAREAAFAGPGKFWGVMRKAPKGGRLDPIEADINRLIARVRARVEHPFRVIKRPFGHVKARYRGLAKNRAQLFTLFAPGNLFLMRRRLAA
jgi:IS5 family transposase